MDCFECNLSRFQELAYAEESDIIFVSETWLSTDVLNSEILPEDYFIVRNDRDTHGGGVLLAIKSSSFKSAREILTSRSVLLKLQHTATLIFACAAAIDHLIPMVLGWKN